MRYLVFIFFMIINFSNILFAEVNRNILSYSSKDGFKGATFMIEKNIDTLGNIALNMSFDFALLQKKERVNFSNYGFNSQNENFEATRKTLKGSLDGFLTLGYDIAQKGGLYFSGSLGYGFEGNYNYFNDTVKDMFNNYNDTNNKSIKNASCEILKCEDKENGILYKATIGFEFEKRLSLSASIKSFITDFKPTFSLGIGFFY